MVAAGAEDEDDGDFGVIGDVNAIHATRSPIRTHDSR
jgi:hypothetical protein